MNLQEAQKYATGKLAGLCEGCGVFAFERRPLMGRIVCKLCYVSNVVGMMIPEIPEGQEND